MINRIKSIGNTLLMCLILSISYSTHCWGQAQDSLKNISVGFTPQYLFQNGLRIDLEKEYGPKRNRIAVRPYYYNGTTFIYENRGATAFNRSINAADKSDDVSGWGLELMHKFRISRKDKYGYPYVGVGMGYHNVKLKFNEFDWQPEIEDGLAILRFDLFAQEEKVQRFDALIVIGYRAFLGHHFALDFTLGGVARTSWIESSLENPRDHQRGVLLYGFEGNTIRFGITLSMMLE